MRILMVSSFLPYPLFSGGHVRLFNLIKALSGKHEITLVCEKRATQSDDDIREVEKICKKVVTIDRKKQWTAANILQTIASRNSFLLTGHTHPSMREKIAQELEEKKYDLIHIETYYVMQNLPAVSIPIVLVEHNIEYLVYKRYVDNVPAMFRPLLTMDVNKIKKEEERFWENADKLIAVSVGDQNVMKRKDLKPVVVANGVDTEKFTFKNQESRIKNKEKKILFIGDFKWMQNRDAVSFIIKDIWPEINLKLKSQNSKLDSKLWIVGREIPESIKNLTNDSNIIFDEKSSEKSTEEIFQAADVLLAPIRVGGGTSYKILESMSSGTPVVATSMSADAIDAKDGADIIVGETADEIAAKTLQVLHDEKLYDKIARNGRALIEKKYTWEKIAKDLESAYKSLL